MKVSNLAKAFFRELDQRVGPFDRPIQFRVFPFDAGGALNLLTVGAGRKEFVTYVSWDLFGHPRQKRGKLGRYELLVVCDDENWAIETLTNIGRQSLQTVFNPGDTLDIGPWVGPSSPLQGVIFEQVLKLELDDPPGKVSCGLLGCIGITRSELEFAIRFGVEALVEQLKGAGIYPRTMTRRGSIDLRHTQHG
jgi:hypothetical protein